MCKFLKFWGLCQIYASTESKLFIQVLNSSNSLTIFMKSFTFSIIFNSKPTILNSGRWNPFAYMQSISISYKMNYLFCNIIFILDFDRHFLFLLSNLNCNYLFNLSSKNSEQHLQEMAEIFSCYLKELNSQRLPFLCLLYRS
jgi:hypothetical protein